MIGGADKIAQPTRKARVPPQPGSNRRIEPTLVSSSVLVSRSANSVGSASAMARARSTVGPSAGS